MKPIQFRWIEAFRAVAVTGSTIEAAGLLQVDQSVVSRQISSLEGQLGLRLFDRANRALRLTAEGVQLLGEAEAAIETFNRFRQKADLLGQRPGDHLHVVASATLARGLLPAVLKAFRSRAPNVKVNVEAVARTELDRKLESQQFDICTVAFPVAYARDSIVELGRFPGVCIIPKCHRLAKLPSIPLSELEGENLVGLPVGTVGRLRVDDLFHKSGIAYRPVVETTAVALNEIVAAGLGLAITDPFSARASRAPPATGEVGGFVIRPLTPTIDYQFGILFPIARARSQVVSAFAETVQACARSVHAATGSR